MEVKEVSLRDVCVTRSHFFAIFALMLKPLIIIKLNFTLTPLFTRSLTNVTT